MEARERRMAENEVRFRALNERLRKGSDTWGPGDGVLELVCECADEDCTRSITLTPRDYEAVRERRDAVHGRARATSAPRSRTSSPSGTAGCVVRKRGEAAEIAADADPRA